VSTEPGGGAEELVLLEHRGNGVSRITLNRPEKRNAMNLAARRALVRALEECRGRAKVIILAGNGPAFCAGIDLKELKELASGPESDESGLRTDWPAVQETIRRHPAIVIAAVGGIALGGGSTLINVSDLAVAAEDAAIGMPEIGFGVYPTLAGPAAQLRISPKRAAWMVLTGQRIDGTTAADWGMVNLAVPREELDATVTALAEHIAGFDATALERAKQALWKIPGEISEWTSAIAYGQQVAVEIAEHSDASAQGLSRFRAGERNKGQGL
jgi:enoyl-CoA hydratase/carnithine racemase